MKFGIVFFSIICALPPFSVQIFIPMSPCIDIFRYHQLNVSDAWVGLVSIPPPPDWKLPIKVQVFLYLEAVLPTKYAGILELNEPRHDVFTRLQSRSWSPIQYIVRFPLPSPLPTIKNISINDNLLCIGPPVFGPVITTIHLKNTLFPRINYVTRSPDLDVRNILNIGDAGNINTPSHYQEDQSELKLGDICGQPVLANPLVAGGQQTLLGEWPWLVAVYISRPLGLTFHCSATLISNQHVVTAAHCLNHERTGLLSVDSILLYLGKYNLQNWTEPFSVLRQALEFYIHPDYNSHNLSNDLAVVKFEPVKFTAYIRPACLWNGFIDLDPYVGVMGTVAGWGRNSSLTLLNKKPQSVKLQLVSQEKCLRSRPSFVYFTTEKTLCAGNRNGTGPCNGDSGSGLFLMRDDKWELRGIVSLSLLNFTTQSCNLNEFIVFTDTAKYHDWLSPFVT